ncbi:unnamed protein product [Sphagnum troendelagicum]|uniref:Uncharacterized protein n=1 Tax=Sphagnum troendelagicum TaxID=128251 RepID=A0ABP0U1I8_9BRYO
MSLHCQARWLAGAAAAAACTIATSFSSCRGGHRNIIRSASSRRVSFVHHSAVRRLRALKHGNWDGRRVVLGRSRRRYAKFACLLSVADDVGGGAQAAATTTTRDKKFVNKNQQQHQGSNSSSSTEKHEFDNIQDLIVSPPTVATTTKGSKKAAAVGAAAAGGIRELPTLLEREARAREGSSNFSRRERNEAVNGLLDLLEQKGVTPGYAFEFVRYAGELIDILIAEAKQTSERDQAAQGSTGGGGADDEDDFPSLAARVSMCAEQQGLARLVFYFQLISMKAVDVPKLLPFVGWRIDVVMAKVEFLRSIGVRYEHLPGILSSWPQLLSYECDRLALVAEYLTSIGLTLKEIGKLVTKYPKILGQDVSKDLHPTIMLLENLGISLKDAKRLVVRDPTLFTDKAEKKLGPLVEYLQQIGVQRKHIGSLLDFRPTVLHLESLGVEPGLMGKLFRRHPQLLKNRHNFELKTVFLLNLGLEQKDLGKVIYNAPQLLGLSVEENMVPTVKFLRSLGVKGPALLKVLKTKPMILAYSVEGKLQPNVKFLESIQIQPEDIGKLVTRHPQLLTLSVEKNLKPTVSYFLDLGFTKQELPDMIRRLPSLLGFSITTVLDPKYRYLVDSMKRSRAELVQFPQFFSYSLAKRIIPRHNRLGELFGSLSLGSVYGCSDEVFEKKVQRLLTQSSSHKSSLVRVPRVLPKRQSVNNKVKS